MCLQTTATIYSYLPFQQLEKSVFKRAETGELVAYPVVIALRWVAEQLEEGEHAT